MNAIIVSGGSKNGSSLYISKKIKEKLFQSEIIDLSQSSIMYCDGCLSCDETHVCHYSDDMSIIIPKLECADVIIFVSPARWNLISGDMKVFMDRLNPTAVIQSLSKKKVAAFAVGQTSEVESDSLNNVISSIEFFCKSADLEVVFSSTIGNCLTVNDTISIDTIVESEIDKMISKLEELVDD